LKIGRVIVHLDHIPRFIANANRGIMSPAVKLWVADCVADCVRLAMPQATEWQHIGD